MHAPAPPHRQRGRDGPVVRPPATGGIPPEHVRGRPSLSLRLRVSYYPTTRAHVRLLGPCFKTGRVEGRPIRHRPYASGPTPVHPRKRSADTVAQSLPVETSRESGAAYAGGGSSVPRADRDRRGCNSKRREAPTYLPRRLLTAREPVVALCLRKVHTAGRRRAPGESNQISGPAARAHLPS